MNRLAHGNLLIAQGGGPTAVINCSLYGVIQQALLNPAIDRILGARHGIAGVLKESFINLANQPVHVLEGLCKTPASALGSCRYKVQPQDNERILDVLKKYNIRYFLYNGGNDSMDTAQQVHQLAQHEGYQLHVIGIPKTIDNDLPHTDRCPGFGSAARYVAQSVRDLAMDIRALPTPVSIFETMGRNAGWLAASAVLARHCDQDAPHLIYLPERAFDVDRFLGDVDHVMRRQGWVVVVVSEGLCDAQGQPIYQVNAQTQRDAFGHTLPGDVGAFLASTVSTRLNLRCRSEKPGLCGRSSILHVSPADQADAQAVGRAAVDAVCNGHSGQMITLQAIDPTDTLPRTSMTQLADVANVEKHVPDDWITEEDNGVTEVFKQYVRPLIGPPLLRYVELEASYQSVG